jgi:UDP-N-acetylglucosamine 2-epimerase (hydrolysing)
MKKLLFLTGTRADFGKLKPLIQTVDEDPNYDVTVFVTGMHTLSKYGYTVDEVKKANFKTAKIHIYMNQVLNEPMDITLANTINGLSRYVHEEKPDMLIIHGDRVEALAGAIVGAMQNILVAHIEGGELSGTIDEMIRHSTSKMAHLHFVANVDAQNRLKQLGEIDSSIFVIGSPDIDMMYSQSLPDLPKVQSHYDIPFNQYGLVLFHPVTTEIDTLLTHATHLVEALITSNRNYVVIYPNNDLGSHFIFEAYQKLDNNPKFKIFPSIRFEYFLTLLKNAHYIIGNSSAGIREAPAFGVPAINIGTRQHNRFSHEAIINCNYERTSILEAFEKRDALRITQSSHHFGDGKSAQRFKAILDSQTTWDTLRQKQFIDQ